LIGFSIDKTKRVDLGNPVLPPTPNYTQLPPEGNSHFWAKRAEMRFLHGSVVEYRGAAFRLPVASCPVR